MYSEKSNFLLNSEKALNLVCSIVFDIFIDFDLVNFQNGDEGVFLGIGKLVCISCEKNAHSLIAITFSLF